MQGMEGLMPFPMICVYTPSKTHQLMHHPACVFSLIQLFSHLGYKCV